MTEPIQPPPSNAADVHPEDGEQDVSQSPDEVYESEVGDDDGDAGA